jgi:hypothetical protein
MASPFAGIQLFLDSDGTQSAARSREGDDSRYRAGISHGPAATQCRVDLTVPVPVRSSIGLSKAPAGPTNQDGDAQFGAGAVRADILIPISRRSHFPRGAVCDHIRNV